MSRSASQGVKREQADCSCSRFWFGFFLQLSFTVSQMINKISALLETAKLRRAAWLLVTHALAVPFVWLWQVMFTATHGHRVKMPFQTIYTIHQQKAKLPCMLQFVRASDTGGVSRGRAEFHSDLHAMVSVQTWQKTSFRSQTLIWYSLCHYCSLSEDCRDSGSCYSRNGFLWFLFSLAVLSQ